MNISLELYKIFYTVAKNESFSKAAQELYISQSAVSQSIKNLEHNLGFPLFIRTTKQVSLTIDGSILFTYLEEVFNILKNAEEKLKMRQDKYNGQLIFASTDTLCKYVLLSKIKKVTQKYPNIKIKIINGTSIECMNLLQNSEVDFALVNLSKNINTKFKIEKKYTFNDVFVTSKDFNIKDTLTLKEIAEYPLMALDNKSITRKFLDDLFLKNNIDINPEIELQNIDLLIDMAEMGLGISFVPDLSIKGRNLKIIYTQEKIQKREYGILSLKNIPSTPVGQTFLELL